MGQTSEAGAPDPGSNIYTPGTITTTSAGQTQLVATGTTTVADESGTTDPSTGEPSSPGTDSSAVIGGGTPYSTGGINVQQSGGQVPGVPPAPPAPVPTTDPILLALGVGATLIGVGGFAYLVHMRQKKVQKGARKR